MAHREKSRASKGNRQERIAQRPRNSSTRFVDGHVEEHRPDDISRAGTPTTPKLLPIVPVWGITLKVWPANRGNAIVYRECTISLDATWRDVKKVIQNLLEVKQYIPDGDHGWTARFWKQMIDNYWINTKIAEL